MKSNIKLLAKPVYIPYYLKSSQNNEIPKQNYVPQRIIQRVYYDGTQNQVKKDSKNNA